MKKLNSVFLTLLILLLLTLNCRKTEKFKYTGKKGGTMIVSVRNEPGNLNPIYPSFTGLSPVKIQLFTPLIQEKPDGKVRPGLAKSWVYSEDLKSITYTLRKDAEWSDGEPITAEDIVFTVKQIKNPENNSPLSQKLNYVKEVEALGKKKVRFVLTHVYAEELQSTNIRPLPKHVFNEVEGSLRMFDFSKNPVTSGPYRFERWEKGKWIELTANENYFRGRPPLDRIVFYFPESQGELMDELKLGNIDLAYDMPSADYDTLTNYNTILSPRRSYTYIGWNLQRFGERKLRRAFTMAINREALISEVLQGYAEPVNGPITPEHWAFNPEVEGVPYDPEKAEEIIRELGYSKRSWQRYYPDLSVNILVEDGNKVRKNTADFIAENLRNIGVDVEITSLKGTELISRLFNRNFDAYILGWNVEKTFNPFPMWSSEGIYNFVNYRNDRVNNLMRKALLSLDRAQSKSAWFEFQEIIAEDLPYTFLYAPKQINLVKKNLEGVKPEDRRPLIAVIDELHYSEIPSGEFEISSLGEHYRQRSEEEGEETEETTQEETEPTAEEMLQASAPQTVPEEETTEQTVEDTITTSETSAEDTTETEEQEEEAPVIPAEISYFPNDYSYPPEAEKLEISGQVFVKITIDTSGNVSSASVIKGIFPTCDSIAKEAALDCKFDPATQAGGPVESQQTIPVRFPPPGW